MKVLVAHNLYGSREPSGENRVVQDECKLMERSGVEIVRYLPSSDSLIGGGRLTRARAVEGVFSSRDSRTTLRQVIEKESPDVVHVHNVFPLVSPNVYVEAHRLGVPVVQTVHNYRLVCMAGTYFRRGAPCLDCSHGNPWPGVAHGCYRGTRPQSLAMSVGVVRQQQLWPRYVDRFLALTPFMADWLSSQRIPQERITVRPTWCAGPNIAPPLGRNVLFVGRVDRIKGVDDLVRAWGRTELAAERSLEIVGDGPLLPEVRRLSGGLSGIHIHGQLSKDATDAAYARAAIVVVPSNCYEGFPRVIAEAFAVGRGVITTANPNLDSVVTQSAAGIVAPPDELPAALTEGVRRSVELGAAARAYWETRLAPQQAVSSLMDVYRSLK